MTDIAENSFTWRAQETIDAVLEHLSPPARLHISLPDSYNHALFVHLKPSAPPAQAETLDLDDSALLREMCRVEGVESLIGWKRR